MIKIYILKRGIIINIIIQFFNHVRDLALLGSAITLIFIYTNMDEEKKDTYNTLKIVLSVLTGIILTISLYDLFKYALGTLQVLIDAPDFMGQWFMLTWRTIVINFTRIIGSLVLFIASLKKTPRAFIGDSITGSIFLLISVLIVLIINFIFIFLTPDSEVTVKGYIFSFINVVTLVSFIIAILNAFKMLDKFRKDAVIVNINDIIGEQEEFEEVIEEVESIEEESVEETEEN